MEEPYCRCPGCGCCNAHKEVVQLKEQLKDDAGRRSLIQELQALLKSRDHFSYPATADVKADGANLITAIARAFDEDAEQIEELEKKLSRALRG